MSERLHAATDPLDEAEDAIRSIATGLGLLDQQIESAQVAATGWWATKLNGMAFLLESLQDRQSQCAGALIRVRAVLAQDGEPQA
jgi:hypothetical protein